MTIYTTKNGHYQIFPIKQLFCVHKIYVSRRRFFYSQKACVLLTVFKIVHKYALLSESIVTSLENQIQSNLYGFTEKICNIYY